MARGWGVVDPRATATFRPSPPLAFRQSGDRYGERGRSLTVPIPHRRVGRRDFTFVSATPAAVLAGDPASGRPWDLRRSAAVGASCTSTSCHAGDRHDNGTTFSPDADGGLHRRRGDRFGVTLTGTGITGGTLSLVRPMER